MQPNWETASFDPSISQVFAETISMPVEEHWNTRRRLFQLSYLGTVVPGPRYRYTQLSGRGIRLLKIAAQDNRIFCSFGTTSIDDAPPYMAVSYRWGSPKRTHCLLITESNSATIIEINENCFKALCRITPQSTTRYVWIDAVCINQDDEEEKFHQIPLMGEIYSSAVQVVSVFGKERTPGETQHFIRRLVESEQYQEALKPGEFYPISLAGESYNWSQLLPLTFHEYWKRAWIVQEVALSRRLTILYGESEIPWSHIELLLRYFGPENSPRYSRYFTKVDEIHLTVMGSLNAILPFKVFKDRVARDSQMRLSQVAMELRRQEASDPRDHLYAFLGFSQDSSHPELKPNPQHTPEEVYTKFMLFTLSQGDLGILEHMTRPEDYEDTRNLRLPSWVPDLGTNPGPYHLAEYSVLSSPTTRLDYSLSGALGHGFLLHIRGAIVDKLGPHFVLTPPVEITPRSHLVGEKRTGPDLPQASNSLKQYVGAIRIMAENLPEPYPSGINRSEAIIRTLLLDSDGRNRPMDELSVLQMRYGLSEATVNAAFWGNSASILKDLVQRMLPDATDSILSEYQRFLRRCEKAWHTWLSSKLVVTSGGYLAWAPSFARQGDLICAFDGSVSLFVLRPNADDTFEFLGPAYVHGFMTGEADALPRRKFSLK